MIRTETEANNSYCLLPPPDHTTKCSAAKCMAWRWFDPLVDPLTGKPDAKSRRGYCGLAGKPEHEE